MQETILDGNTERLDIREKLVPKKNMRKTYTVEKRFQKERRELKATWPGFRRNVQKQNENHLLG